MKIIGLDGKEYLSVEDCQVADEAFKKAQKADAAAKAAAKAAEKAEISKRKKELADKISNADKEVETAYGKYRDTEKKATDIIKKAKAEANALIKEASMNYSNALKEKAECIGKFNKEFGVYTKVYTGNEALNEYRKLADSIFGNESPFDKLLKFWF